MFSRSALLIKKSKKFSTDTQKLIIKTLRCGDSKNYPKNGDIASVHYDAYLEDGRKIDSSRDRSKPFEFQVGCGIVIRGFDKTVMRLSLGQRVMATLPPEMAYGNQVVRGVIPENSTLVFDIELIDFKS